MRAGLLALGVLLLIFGAVFFFFPATSTTAQGTNVEEAATTTVVARAIIPWQLSLASMITGLIFMLLGIAIPSSQPSMYVENADEDKDVVYEKQKIIHKH